MDRLLVNPMLQDLQMSTVAANVKDMISIAGLQPSLKQKFIFLKVEDGRCVLPTAAVNITGVYLCDYDLPSEYFNKERLNAGTDTNFNRKGGSRAELGNYRVNYGVVYLDIEEAVIEVAYSALEVDEYGYPVFPYDGSLMAAMESYVKFRYYTILSELGKVSDNSVQRVHKEYMWYIGQYSNKINMLSYDQAVAVGNTWQRLVDTRNLDSATDGNREHLNI